jgi:hypothetical protein
MNRISKLAFASLALAMPIVIAAAEPAQQYSGQDHDHQGAHWAKNSPLVSKVRRATERFRNEAVARAEGWVPATPCVSGPNSGAMGIHYVNFDLVGDGVLRADQPEALIYEPTAYGGLRLVGAEFIEIVEVWNTKNTDEEGNPLQPNLEGHLLNIVTAPNRYTLPAFYELHVWAWERNPNGSFSDWNTQVSCDRQPGD